MKLTKKILQRDKLIAELCKLRNWNPNKLSPSQIRELVSVIQSKKTP
jgi:hypothetical protein